MPPSTFHSRVSLFVFVDCGASSEEDFHRISGNRLALHQKLTLTGFNSQLFEKAIDSCAAVYSIFGRYMPPGMLLPLSQGAVHVNDQLYASLSLVNPVLTRPDSDSIGPSTREVEITEGIDPRSVVWKIKGQFLYLEDNKVQIYQMHRGTK